MFLVHGLPRYVQPSSWNSLCFTVCQSAHRKGQILTIFQNISWCLLTNISSVRNSGASQHASIPTKWFNLIAATVWKAQQQNSEINTRTCHKLVLLGLSLFFFYALYYTITLFYTNTWIAFSATGSSPESNLSINTIRPEQRFLLHR